MRIQATRKQLAELDADVGVVFATADDRVPRGVKGSALERPLAARMRHDRFRAGPGDALVWCEPKVFPGLLVVIGLGTGDPDEATLRTAGARAARVAADHRARKLAIVVPDSERASLRAVAEGVALGAYRFERHLSDPDRRTPPIEDVRLAIDLAPATARKEVAAAGIVTDAVCFARDLVNEAPSRLDPKALASEARSMAKKAGLEARVYGPAELRRMKLGALLAVARGSAMPPAVVHLTYKPGGRKRKGKTLLVGKGVTFDSGGLNLKPGASMADMKADMGGAAAVLGAMSGLRAAGCAHEVHALVGLVENMTGGAAYKPGDILTTHSGKTVEVGNTDAEGRLVLCDLLSWGVPKIKPTRVVDLATLTGACVVALGERSSGLFSRHDDLREELQAAAGRAGELVWPLPLYDEYLPLLQKGPADLRNIGGRWGGAITAALFLGEFLPRELPWAHLDIAGPAFTESELPEASPGGTGAGVATLLRWLAD